MAVSLALLAAIVYGVADFAGGLAARRVPVVVVAALSQAVGLVGLIVAVAFVPGTPSMAALGFGALAGVAGASGLLLYYRALAVGPMGIVAPLSAVTAAGLPLAFGLGGGEVLTALSVVAIVLALLAIVLASSGSRQDSAATTGLLLGLASGLGFGLFFVGLDATPPDSGMWALVSGRLVSATLLGALLLSQRRLSARRVPATIGPRVAAAPVRAGLPVGLILLIGVTDTGANVLFLLATRVGELAISGVLVSLYPVVVVLLARAVLAERLTRTQLASAGLALVACALLAWP